MLNLLWLIPIVPFASFLILTLVGGKLAKNTAAILGVGSVGISAAISLLIAYTKLVSPSPGQPFSQTLWTWFTVGSFSAGITFYLDSLSLVMMVVITFVGFLIHLYSVDYMWEEEGFSRFFAYMNLFVGSMLTLILADNLLLLYLGWEGVGLCSYLLIGFWYKDPKNGYAARKAFVVTRVGDTAMAIGLFLIFSNLGTLNIQQLMQIASQKWLVGSTLPILASALLLGGALGKSAQLPLQVWLPDAMAGPTPVSALIHAATMVTAGVYLIARTHVLFELAPPVMLAVAIIGALTLLLAGFSALTQSDIKRVLAYSTISQIGYMFLALGVGAWSAAIFHFATHAFFKALLFLGAGVIILSLHEEHNMFKMGGMRKQLPLTFWTFLIGAASLSALPLVTAGFYSKDLILYQTYASQSGSVWLWAAGLLGAFLTSLYSFRMVFLTFFGEVKSRAELKPGINLQLPLVVLAVLSILAGFVELPGPLGNRQLFSDFLQTTLPAANLVRGGVGTEAWFEVISAIVSILGIYIAYQLYLRSPQVTARLNKGAAAKGLQRLWFSGWGFDWVYERVFVRPYVWFARVNKDDFFDLIYLGITRLSQTFSRALSWTISGQVRRYALGIAAGAVLLIAIMVLL
ncbi:MAG: NADH-quinone oxidoreductase subunit L [Anaerolineaceae bacterium]|nr:NADH-quinone oxidoreductase subunit L [Anaerolineaceae bacterium]